jgi:hypothetical protein
MGEGGQGGGRACRIGRRSNSRGETFKAGLFWCAAKFVKETQIKRNTILAVLALCSAGAATLAAATPVAAIDYPWCIQGGASGACPATARVGRIPNGWLRSRDGGCTAASIRAPRTANIRSSIRATACRCIPDAPIPPAEDVCQQDSERSYARVWACPVFSEAARHGR